jgi:hypothetical protein
MIESEGMRPQDVGRRRTRRPAPPAPETLEILERYRAAMRRELRRTLDSIETLPSEPATERAKRWDLAIKLGRELGARDHVPEQERAARPATPARAPRLSARERRALGAEVRVFEVDKARASGE